MESVARYGTVSGMLAAILILGGEAVASAAKPVSVIASADEWRDSELAIEIGAQRPCDAGTLLFLLFLATLVRLLAPDISARMTAFTGVAFFVLMAAADVSNSTTASALGFYDELTGLEVVSGFFNTLGFHPASTRRSRARTARRHRRTARGSPVSASSRDRISVRRRRRCRTATWPRLPPSPWPCSPLSPVQP